MTAAAIAYDVFKNKKAEKIPTAPSENNNMDIALMAINYLLYVRDPAPFVEFVTRVKSSQATYNVKAAANDFLGKFNLVKNDAEYEDEYFFSDDTYIFPNFASYLIYAKF